MFAICLGRVENHELVEISALRGMEKSLQRVLAIQFVTRLVTPGISPLSITELLLRKIHDSVRTE
jgi:hypothetical protein